MDADAVIAALELEPHPEGGHYRETWRAPSGAGIRAAGSSIYYLLRRSETSRWHRIDATEIWHWYAGAPLRLTLSSDGTGPIEHVLGNDLAGAQHPQVIVPAGIWQSASSLGAWTLAGCTVSPAFEFDRFDLAPDGWSPP